MESPRDNENVSEITTNVTPSVDSGGQEGSPPIAQWSQEFGCYIVNGILAPLPLSAIQMEVVAEDELQESSPGQGESSQKRRKTEDSEEILFMLFKFPQAFEQYLLETHEVKTSGVNRHYVIVNESNKRWKVGVHDLEPGDYVVLPVLQDPDPLIFHKKYNLSLEERLDGWTLEKRKRGNGKEDKFYYHRARQFRSFVEVATYILYSCKVKDLLIMSTNKTSPEVETEVAEAVMTTLSSCGVKTEESNSASTKSVDDQLN